MNPCEACACWSPHDAPEEWGVCSVLTENRLTMIDVVVPDEVLPVVYTHRRFGCAEFRNKPRGGVGWWWRWRSWGVRWMPFFARCCVLVRTQGSMLKGW